MEFFLDIDGNEIRTGDSVEVIDSGKVIAKGIVAEYDEVGVWINAYEYGNYHAGNGIGIDISDVIPKHFRKID